MSSLDSAHRSVPRALVRFTRLLEIVGALLAILVTAEALADQGSRETQSIRLPVDVSKLGPQLGERVPDFTLSDQHGKTWTLSSLMGPNGAMLVFHRSADW